MGGGTSQGWAEAPAGDRLGPKQPCALHSALRSALHAPCSLLPCPCHGALHRRWQLAETQTHAAAPFLALTLCRFAYSFRPRSRRRRKSLAGGGSSDGHLQTALLPLQVRAAPLRPLRPWLVVCPLATHAHTRGLTPADCNLVCCLSVCRAPEDERFYGESPHRVGSNTTVVFGILAWTLLGLLYHYVAISKVRYRCGAVDGAVTRGRRACPTSAPGLARPAPSLIHPAPFCPLQPVQDGARRISGGPLGSGSPESRRGTPSMLAVCCSSPLRSVKTPALPFLSLAFSQPLPCLFSPPAAVCPQSFTARKGKRLQEAARDFAAARARH